MFSNQQQGGSPVSSFWNELPIFYKLLFIVSLFTGILSVFTELLGFIFINIPYYTLFYANLWRLFTAALLTVGFLNSIFGIFVLYFIQPQIEKRISTVITVCDFFITNTLIQIFFSLVWIPLYILNKQKNKLMNSSGLFPIWIVYLVRICYSDQQGEIRMCCLPFNIQKKYYPLVILGLIMLFNWSIPYDLIIAALLTFIQCKFFSGSMIKFKRSTFLSIESSFLFKLIINRNDFCSLNDSNDTKYFCKNQETDRYYEFYSDLMNNGQSSQTSNSNSPIVRPYNYGGEYNQGSYNENSLSNMKGGVTISTGIKSVVTIEDVRNHWANKDTQEVESIKLLQEEVKDQGITITKNKKTKEGYINFGDQN